ncbi:endoribonuclease MazF [Helicobacter sp. MIT 01-3238]|uniref:endoribonuclease MazF n=1 Tax=Helicobacter sp. MIT 01-3238 TaxID=398627 RepID=UPI000E1E8C81|nr:endoribonuclease MazF [Helicobacter sp. MIT 01-3238]RDU53206.1 endoribonuclease MazF [Helicobacter sp. MIT 01-3238]
MPSRIPKALSKAYTPKRGDIIWLDFDPRSGHEQGRMRPALVLSPEEYNSKSGLCLAMPITSKVKGYPFEIALKSKKIDGVILSDHIKSLDFRARNARFCDKVDSDTLQCALHKLSLLLF